jgi:hypothetical protein
MGRERERRNAEGLRMNVKALMLVRRLILFCVIAKIT